MGFPFWKQVERIKELKRAGRTSELESLLLRCVDATETQNRRDKHGVAPAYYEELAILYRKERRLADEVAILERYERQRHAPGALPAKLAARLVRAQETARQQSG